MSGVSVARSGEGNATGEGEKRPLRARLAGRAAGAAAWGAIAVAAVGLIVRLTVRDRWTGAALVYYALPLPVTAMLIGVAAAFFAARRRRRWLPASGATFAAALALLGWWGAGAYHARGVEAAEPGAGTIKLVYWTIDDAAAGWERAAERVRAENADVIALGEAGSRHVRSWRFWNKNFPEYAVVGPDRGFALMVRGEADDLGRFKLDRGRGHLYHVKSGASEFTLVLVDLDSNPFFSRRESLAGLDRRLAGLAPGPIIVAGDFNTPVDSVFLDPMRARYRHAFEEAGEGWFWTWPAWLPFQAIDHVWYGGGVEIRRCTLETTALSAHRIVKVEIAVGDERLR